jgi:hypothetical protein
MASARRPRTFSRPAATKGAEGGGVTTDREDDGGGDRYKQRVSIFQVFTLHPYLLPNAVCVLQIKNADFHNTTRR